MHSESDFDVRHMINSNAVWDLPIGAGGPTSPPQAPSWMRFSEAGDFPVSGGGTRDYRTRLRSDAQVWATNWNAQSYGVRVRSVESSPTKGGDHPNMFSNPTQVYQSFRNAYAGDTGTGTSSAVKATSVSISGCTSRLTCPSKVIR